MGRVGGLDLTTSKNDAQATFAVTADSSFRQMMAAVAPPAGHRREVCRCVADIVRISATWLTPPGCRVLWITHAHSAVRPKRKRPASVLKILRNPLIKDEGGGDGPASSHVVDAPGVPRAVWKHVMMQRPRRRMRDIGVISLDHRRTEIIAALDCLLIGV
jgi:hypothetical protein